MDRQKFTKMMDLSERIYLRTKKKRKGKSHADNFNSNFMLLLCKVYDMKGVGSIYQNPFIFFVHFIEH